MKKWLLSLSLLIILSCSSKENNYNRMLDWINSIPKGTSVNDVKAKQPNFVMIHWDNPDTLGGRILFSIEPKKYYDILKMDNRIVFNKAGYIGRSYHK